MSDNFFDGDWNAEKADLYPNALLVGAMNELDAEYHDYYIGGNSILVDWFCSTPGSEIERIENLLVSYGEFPKLYLFALKMPGADVQRIIRAFAERREESRIESTVVSAEEYIEDLLEQFPKLFTEDEKMELLSGVSL